MIDHIICSQDSLRLITGAAVLEHHNFNVSDHLPVVCSFNLVSSEKTNDFGFTSFAWNKARKDGNVVDYTYHVSNGLWTLASDSIDSITDLETCYNEIVTALLTASNEMLTRKKFKKFLKPFWCETLKTLHRQMRVSRQEWIRHGKNCDADDPNRLSYKLCKTSFRRELRRASNDHISNHYNELDSAYDMDQKLFWSLVKRGNPKSSSGASFLSIGGNILRDERAILDGWASHFKSIFTNQDDESFDDRFKAYISNFVNECKVNSPNSVLPLHLLTSPSEIRQLCSKLKRNKAADIDGIVYEHLIHGGECLYHHLSNLFNAVLKLKQVPTKWKHSVIVPLFKGGNKPRSNPNSYRGISLTPTIGKLFEKLLETRLSSLHPSSAFPNKQQVAYQKGLSSLHASFNLQETVHYYQARSNSVYVAFLDSTKAFDCVWHDGLLYKLRMCGTHPAIWSVINDMYTDMKSCVRAKNQLSRDFTLDRGIRQGGVLSAKLYLLFINDLLDELSNSSFGASLLGVKVCCPTQADDVAIVSSSLIGLQRLLQICETYSRRWRFCFSPTKSVILNFSISTKSIEKEQIYLCNHELPIVSTVKHVGITLSDTFKSKDRTIGACRAIRSGVTVLAKSGVHQDGLNPLISAKLIKQCVYAKALYGCQLWNNLTREEIAMLERAQHFACKYVLGLNLRTRSDMCTSLLGWGSLESYIDERKLFFFGHILNMNPKYLPRSILITRLLEYNLDCTKHQKGFIPDVWRIINKYNLNQYMSMFLQNRVFLGYCSWKRIVKQAVTAKECNDWKLRMSLHNDFRLFSQIQSELSPHPVFSVWMRDPSLKVACRIFVRACTAIRQNDDILVTELCEKCGRFFSSRPEHLGPYSRTWISVNQTFNP
ncbi:hypothetical protein SNE40_005971 [Patella caerulea]|uniref:Reverse transcriptase domain-containing protein n=1 Tax=Patella caerulea TaxID=87958 RepID=A0AAN8Q3Y1_PATCE